MKIIFLFLSILSFTIVCKSQSDSGNSEAVQVSQSKIYIETDPTTFFFNGYSLAIRRSATLHKKLSLGVGVYKAVLPEFYIEAEEVNKGKNWGASSRSIDLFMDYFFTNPNKGFSLGLVMSYFNYDLTRLNKKVSYQSIVETLRLGYLWRPIKKFDSLYLYPWIGISTGQKISGNNAIDGETFTLQEWSFVPTVQVGFSF